MSSKVLITVGNVTLRAEFGETACARAILAALPLQAGFNTWGDEFYFEVPVRMGLDETATTSVAVGDIGYWPRGNALAIFFGPTPMSTTTEPVPASEVNIVGKVLDDATRLRAVAGAGTIKVQRTEK